MGFFEEFGELMKKYNFEIHTIQLDENIKRMNERFRLALKKEDLPPPVILFRTTEGDYIPSVFGPITLKNEEQNVKFLNVKDNSIRTLFPVEEKKEEPKVEEAPKTEEVKVEEPKKRGRKPKKTEIATEEVKIEKTKNSEKKVEVEPVVVKQEENKKEVNKEELTPEEEKAVTDQLNKLADTLESSGMSWSEVPQKVEEKPKKVERAKSDRYIIISNLYNDANYEMGSYSKFIENNNNTLQKFDTLINVYEKYLNEKTCIELKVTSKECKEVIKKVEDDIKNNFDKIVVLDNYKKSPIAKKIVKDLKEQGIEVIKEKDF